MLKVVVISLYYTVKVLIWSELLDLQIQRRNVQRSRRRLQKNRRRARSRRSTHKTSPRRWMNPSRRRATFGLSLKSRPRRERWMKRWERTRALRRHGGAEVWRLSVSLRGARSWPRRGRACWGHCRDWWRPPEERHRAAPRSRRNVPRGAAGPGAPSNPRRTSRTENAGAPSEWELTMWLIVTFPGM